MGNGWTVLAHDPIEKLAENLWRVRGSLPRMTLKRVMTVARLDDGRLVVHSPAGGVGDAGVLGGAGPLSPDGRAGVEAALSGGPGAGAARLAPLRGRGRRRRRQLRRFSR